MCNNDSELIDLIGKNYFDILRFFILTNKAQLITIPNNMKVYNEKIEGYQFLVSFVSPESELIFMKKREQFGAKWFWHGSITERWYRILHTGLKDGNCTKYQVNDGPIYGFGIYLSDSYAYSLCYCREPATNLYKNSKLPKLFSVISLTENAAVPELNSTKLPREFTQRDDEAIITRVLFVNEINADNIYANYQYSKDDMNTIQKPPIVPSLSDIMNSKFTT